MVDPSLFTLPYDIALCRALRSRGCELVLYGRPPRTLETLPEDANIRRHFYRYSEYVKDRVPGSVFQLLKGLEHAGDMARLLKVLGRGRGVVVHFQWTPLPIFDSAAIDHIRRRIGPVVFTAHDIKPFNDAPTSPVQRVGSTGILRHVDHIIVHSETSRTILCERGLSAEKISVVPHGVISMDQGDSKPQAADGSVTILLFGRLKPYKGIDIMIEALGRLPADIRSRCRILVVGEPKMPVEPLMNRAAELGVSENISWDLRFVSDADMANVFSQVDIFAFPYREIDTSGVLMACLPYGKPIIATNIGAFPKILTDGLHGRIIPPEDTAALSATLEELLADPAARRRYGDNVAQLCRQVPTWDAIADQTIGIYQRLGGEWASTHARSS